MSQPTNSPSSTRENALSGFIQAAGVILAVSYPVLALSTGVRAVYQLFMKEGEVDRMAAALSGLAALVYLVATIGFVIRKRWAWYVSFIALVFELVMVLVVSIISYAQPDLIGRTVWGHFGADYGFFPLIQPILGLAWLLHPQTRRTYGVDPAATEQRG